MYKFSWIFLLSALFFMGCADSQSKKVDDKKEDNNKNSTSQKPNTKNSNSSKTSKKKNKTLPTLNFDNYKTLLTEYGKENQENLVLIETEFGDIKIKLYDEVPLHRASFIHLVKRGYFNTTVFYRVKENFVVQGGNSDSWETQELKAEIGNFKMEPEIVPELFHKRGAVAMARNYKNNPDKLSSPYTFYIVQRGPVPENELQYLIREEGKEIPDEHYQHYLKYGGTPSLDGEHTVIGEVVEGMEVADEMVKVETDQSDWPLDDIYIKMKVLD